MSKKTRVPSLKKFHSTCAKIEWLILFSKYVYVSMRVLSTTCALLLCVRVSQNSKEERRQVECNAHARQSKNAVFSGTFTNHNNGECNSVSSLKRTINPL